MDKGEKKKKKNTTPTWLLKRMQLIPLWNICGTTAATNAGTANPRTRTSATVTHIVFIDVLQLCECVMSVTAEHEKLDT